MPDKIMTLHPEGKAGVNIDKDKYDEMKAAILAILQDSQPLGFTEMMEAMPDVLPDFDGSINWYYTTVKLDLEARGLIVRKKIKGKQFLYLGDENA